MRTYLIAFTMRSGSTLLCDYLASNGLGYPAEYFQYPFGVANKWYYEQLNCSTDDFMGYINKLLVHRVNNDIFGAKIAWNQKNALLEKAKQCNPSICEVSDLFPEVQWIYLRRRDKIAQAVSIWRASITGQWHLQRHLPVQEAHLQPPDYSFPQILAFLALILVEEHLWENYFSRLNLQPYVVYYEDLVDDTRSTLMSLIDYIQGSNKIVRDASLLKLNTNLIKLSDQWSEIFRSRFLEDLYHVGASEYWSQFGGQSQGSSRWFQEWTAQAWLDFFTEGKND